MRPARGWSAEGSGRVVLPRKEDTSAAVEGSKGEGWKGEVWYGEDEGVAVDGESEEVEEGFR